jgi:hypothetical protein
MSNAFADSPTATKVNRPYADPLGKGAAASRWIWTPFTPGTMPR